ncbi:HAD superfamily hydrolase (TIGR01450 family) [Asanoa ferruginea]|uniref:HAD superfamily hydrolase (TIGR01450 family) n=1 Tax=Asanoa ferruginea TaxID=53367 RepID=A0A3D9ZN92_9ACTN|nr:HAD-IIA family hydrolase [Asanoa ferruginea]REF98838.1 HAD superfamily hydrolase (TIGR01450 family) [Asanoa ferruginea]GIF53814.1 acid sugar phosphatase [Asanoa ferruginea]
MSTPPRGRLADAYDLVIFDLDGVIYLSDKAVAGAVEAVQRLHDQGRSIAYATNNASRRAAEVADLLTGLGVPAAADEVLTSAAAAARRLGDRLDPGARVLVVGAEALRQEVVEAGLTPVGSADDQPVAVVQGYGRDVGWVILAEAALAVRAGALWIATNTDRTLPSPRGPLPGNGSLVAVLRTALDREPDEVIGKPQPVLFEEAVKRDAADRPIVVGDRLDTDIEGAVGAGLDSLLVLTGVSQPKDLIAAPPHQRPTYVARDLAGLFDDVATLAITGNGETGWRISEGRLDGHGDPIAALRTIAAAAWDGTDVSALSGATDEAAKALRALGL